MVPCHKGGRRVAGGEWRGWGAVRAMHAGEVAKDMQQLFNQYGARKARGTACRLGSASSGSALARGPPGRGRVLFFLIYDGPPQPIIAPAYVFQILISISHFKIVPGKFCQNSKGSGV